MFKVREDKEDKIIDFQSLKMKDVIEVCETINAMFQDGYEIATDVPPRQVPKIPRMLNMRFVKVGAERDLEGTSITFSAEEVTEDPEETIDIDSMKSKKELLRFAEEKEIEVPEDITHPKSIQKFLKDHMGLK